MGFWDLFTSPAPIMKYDDRTATFECDYDNNPTGLYQAMENQAWLPALEFFETGKWPNSILSSSIFATEDPIPAEKQARTWVTRYEADGRVRWSQLPIHAAIIFKAPFKIVQILVTLYPQGVRCTDDQHMLPLHLAIKHGADDNVLRLLIEYFPEAIATKEAKGRLPTQIEGPRHDRTKTLEAFVAYTAKTVEKQLEKRFEADIFDLKDALRVKDKLNKELKLRTSELELQVGDLKKDKAKLEQAMVDLKSKIKTLPKIRGSLLNQKQEVRAPIDPEDFTQEASGRQKKDLDESSPAANSVSASRKSRAVTEKKECDDGTRDMASFKRQARQKDNDSSRAPSLRTDSSARQRARDSQKAQNERRGDSSSKSSKSRQSSTRKHDIRQSEPTDPAERSAKPRQKPRPERSDEKSHQNSYREVDSIATNISNAHHQSMKSKKLNRRGFFKGFGAKE